MSFSGTAARLCDLPRYKVDWPLLCAILPVYLEDGTNGTRILYADGTEEFTTHRLDWVVDDLLDHFRTSRAVLAEKSRDVLGKDARRVPLILNRLFCLVPVKWREVQTVKDGITGYIMLQQVWYTEAAGQGTLVRFNSQVQIQVRDKYRTLTANLRQARNMQGALAA